MILLHLAMTTIYLAHKQYIRNRPWKGVVYTDVGSNAKKSDISQYCDNFNDL
jgi:hypothetical protein